MNIRSSIFLVLRAVQSGRKIFGSCEYSSITADRFRCAVDWRSALWHRNVPYVMISPGSCRCMYRAGPKSSFHGFFTDRRVLINRASQWIGRPCGEQSFLSIKPPGSFTRNGSNMQSFDPILATGAATNGELDAPSYQSQGRHLRSFQDTYSSIAIALLKPHLR